jgi:hypothetical protein
MFINNSIHFSFGMSKYLEEHLEFCLVRIPEALTGNVDHIAIFVAPLVSNAVHSMLPVAILINRNTPDSQITIEAVGLPPDDTYQ